MSSPSFYEYASLSSAEREALLKRSEADLSVFFE